MEMELDTDMSEEQNLIEVKNGMQNLTLIDNELIQNQKIAQGQNSLNQEIQVEIQNLRNVLNTYEENSLQVSQIPGDASLSNAQVQHQLDQNNLGIDNLSNFPQHGVDQLMSSLIISEIPQSQSLIQNQEDVCDRKEFVLKSNKDFFDLLQELSNNQEKEYGEVTLVLEILLSSQSDVEELFKLFLYKNFIIKELRFSITQSANFSNFSINNDTSSFMDESDMVSDIFEKSVNLDCLTINDYYFRLSGWEVEHCLSLINPASLQVIKYQTSFDLIRKDWFVDFIEECSNLKALIIQSSSYVCSNQEEYKQLRQSGRKQLYCMSDRLALSLDRMGVHVENSEYKSILAQIKNKFQIGYGANQVYNTNSEFMSQNQNPSFQENENQLPIYYQVQPHQRQSPQSNPIPQNDQYYDFADMYLMLKETLQTVQMENIQLTDNIFCMIFSELEYVEFPIMKEILLQKNKLQFVTQESQNQFLNLLKGGQVENIDMSSNRLYLSQNLIFDSGAKLIACSLKLTSSLQNINLSKCLLTLNSLEGLLEAAKPMKSLQTLDLSGNDYSLEVESRFIQHKSNDFKSQELSLDFSNCKFTPRSILCITKLIVENMFIQRLVLAENRDLKNKGIVEILESLLFNKQLKVLDISSCLEEYPTITDPRVKFLPV
eukprot:403365519